MLITNTLIFTQLWDSRYTKNMKYNDLAIVTEFGLYNKLPTMKKKPGASKPLHFNFHPQDIWWHILEAKTGMKSHLDPDRQSAPCSMVSR